MPYSCYVEDVEVTDNLRETLETLGASSEAIVTIAYQPLAVFRVRPVVRCTDTMPGHTEVRPNRKLHELDQHNHSNRHTYRLSSMSRIHLMANA